MSQFQKTSPSHHFNHVNFTCYPTLYFISQFHSTLLHILPNTGSVFLKYIQSCLLYCNCGRCDHVCQNCWLLLCTCCQQPCTKFACNEVWISSIASVIILLQITSDTKFNRRTASRRLRAALDFSAADVPTSVQFVTDIPPLARHEKHYVGTVSNVLIRIYL